MRTPSPPLRTLSSNNYLALWLSAIHYHRSRLARRLRRLFPRTRSSTKMIDNKPLPSSMTRMRPSPTTSHLYPYTLTASPLHSRSSDVSGHLARKFSVRRKSISPNDRHTRRSSLTRSKSLRCPPRRGSSKPLPPIPGDAPPSLKRDFSFEASPIIARPPPASTETTSTASSLNKLPIQPQPIPPYPAPPLLKHPQVVPSHQQVHQPPTTTTPPSATTTVAQSGQENLADLAAFINLHLLQSLLQPLPGTETQPQASNSARQAALRTFYLHILRRTHVTPTHILLALKYVQRLCSVATGLGAAQPGIYAFASNMPSGVKLTPRAILLVSLVLAGKYLDDVKRYANSAWAEVGGMSVADLNAAERECLAALSWNLMVSREEFDAWVRDLETLIRSSSVAAAPAMKQFSTSPPQFVPAR